MRLKKLMLQGYKTFASKTEFIFDEGITAIVGPNGSGKSNIADAVRWVLGEQSYSTLRGKRTTDMIFAGSRTRPRAGMAQAILTLDNSDGWLPIDYSEVEIGRRAFRSGENEYILNGQKVRLKDITDLLATSGLSQRTYTIIGQGLVDQALSLRAEERRALFEEAAGINHYKSRRAETLRRLQETQRNLQRLYDILAEIRPRLNSLRRQANRARNYKQLTTDLIHLLTIWYGYRWEISKKELRLVRQTADKAEKSWQESRRKMRVRQENSDDLRRRINRLQMQVVETETSRDEVRDGLEQQRRELAILRERKKSLQNQLGELEQDLPAVESQLQQAANILEKAVIELNVAQGGLQENQQVLLQFNQTFKAQQTKIDQTQHEIEILEKELRQAQDQRAQKEGQFNQLLSRLSEQDDKMRPLATAELQALDAELEKLGVVMASAQSKADKLQKERDDLLLKRQDLIVELKTLRRELRQEEQALNRQQKELARSESRVETLNQLRQVSLDTSGIPILGNLANLLTIPPVYETALQTALADRLETVILQDEGALWQLLTKQADTSPIRALALDIVELPETPEIILDEAVIGWASGLVHAGPAAEKVAQLLLGLTLVVKDAAAALRLGKALPPGSTAVSLDGVLVHAGGLLERPASGKNSLLARETAWRAAQADVAAFQKEIAGMESSVSKLQEQINSKQILTDELNQEEVRLGRVQQEANHRLTQAQRQVDRQQQQKRYLEQQHAAQQAEQSRLHKQKASLELEITAEGEKSSAFQVDLAAARVRLQALPVAEAQQQKVTLQQSIQSAQTIVAGRQAVVDSRRATLEQLEKQKNRLDSRLTAIQNQLQSLAIEEKTETTQAAEEKLSLLENRLRPLRKDLNETRAELAVYEEETAEIQKEAHDQETIFTQARIALTQAKNEIEALQDRIKNDLGVVSLHFDEDQTGPTPLPMKGVPELPVITELPEDIEKTILHQRGQIQRMGAINPDAPEEYDEVLERHDFMEQQIEDLNLTEAQLREVIAELDKLTSKAFAETVEKVNKIFGEIFTQLFGGGSARLLLTDPDDLTVSGVDIIARLPNRREQGLGLLSGGERSLTAAALIFSLLHVSPTPFCVMDEVDAALDEANINRFRDHLRDLSLNSQIIVITHNRGTVQVAQTIYGISMSTDSSSQVISLKPEEYVKQTELI
jgi:chromosome segregation protein